MFCCIQGNGKDEGMRRTIQFECEMNVYRHGWKEISLDFPFSLGSLSLGSLIARMIES